MYEWITGRKNLIGGECPHKCSYCYVEDMKRFPVNKERYSGQPRLIESELKKKLQKNKVYFIGTCIDMFAEDIPDSIITKAIDYCLPYKNTFLFQSKNPIRFYEFWFPDNTILGTTIESNRNYEISKAPAIGERIEAMQNIPATYEKMITLEPLLDFDVDELIGLIAKACPNWVNIGADSKRHNLPEPSWSKVETLIHELEQFTEVRIKPNLNRLNRG
jgi:DNA repair photolyase